MINIMESVQSLFVNDFTIKTSYYLLAAASTMTAFSWNETFKSIIDTHFAELKHRKIYYSLLVTFILVLLIRILPDITEKSEKFKNPIIPSLRM